MTETQAKRKPFTEVIDGAECIHDTNNNKSKYVNPQYRGLVHVKPGQVLNPKGRPKGVRNKLSEQFLDDLKDVWTRKGMQALEIIADKHPDKLLGAMVAVLPKDFQVSVTDDSKGRWVINASPTLSIEEWQALHGLPAADSEES